jgi:hypothetical protein
MKPNSKPPGTTLLKLKFDILLSISAFKLNLRRYNEVIADAIKGVTKRSDVQVVDKTLAGTAQHVLPATSSDEIGRFRYIAWVKCPYRVVAKA